MILLMTGYNKEPIATGSSINHCICLMTMDKTFNENSWVIIGQADTDTD